MRPTTRAAPRAAGKPVRRCRAYRSSGQEQSGLVPCRGNALVRRAGAPARRRGLFLAWPTGRSVRAPSNAATARAKRTTRHLPFGDYSLPFGDCELLLRGCDATTARSLPPSPPGSPFSTDPCATGASPPTSTVLFSQPLPVHPRKEPGHYYRHVAVAWCPAPPWSAEPCAAAAAPRHPRHPVPPASGPRTDLESIGFSSYHPRTAVITLHRIPDPLPADISDVCDKSCVFISYSICVWRTQELRVCVIDAVCWLCLLDMIVQRD